MDNILVSQTSEENIEVQSKNACCIGDFDAQEEIDDSMTRLMD